MGILITLILVWMVAVVFTIILVGQALKISSQEEISMYKSPCDICGSVDHVGVDHCIDGGHHA